LVFVKHKDSWKIVHEHFSAADVISHQAPKEFVLARLTEPKAKRMTSRGRMRFIGFADGIQSPVKPAVWTNTG
jgi:hypothetical protein